ncbi:MAG: hypothetical protein A4E29_00015 [Methanomassiliicoccales archaeon PtaB.Bin134]|nr:MAG: hypothetical protein A4E29_00015 [Methanomassiliicoccales archaeon PtaB.Bin134]
MNLVMTASTDNFTYDDLTEVARREQRNKTIADVRKDLYQAMAECQEMLKRESEREFAADPFSTKSKLASNQLLKFQEKAAQVFGFRMGKLLDMALRAAEGNRTETSRLTIEEKEIYDEVYSLLKEKRSLLLENVRTRIVEVEEPSLATAEVPDMVKEAKREEVEEAAVDVPVYPKHDVDSEAEATPPTVDAEIDNDGAVDKELYTSAPVAAQAAPPTTEFVILRVLEDIPKFVGPDRTYTLRKEDLVCLPSTISKALIARKKAVAVSVVPSPR